jgi:hypothetical protein
MQRYDPLEAPRPEEWLGLDERWSKRKSRLETKRQRAVRRNG